MTPAPTDPARIQRIVVALAESPVDEMLEALAELASAMEAELSGLFVEDINLVRLAELSFSRAISGEALEQTVIAREAMERELRARARNAERMLAEIAHRAGVRWSFRVARGLIDQTLLDAAEEADLLAFGGIRQALLGREELRLVGGETAGREGRREKAAARGPVAVVFNRSASAARILDTASRLARRTGRPLLVFIVADSEEGAELLNGELRRLLEGRGAATVRRLIAPGIAGLIGAVREARPCALVIDADKEILSRPTLRALQQALSCPMLFVR